MTLDLKKAMKIERQIETPVAETKVMMGAADGTVHAVQQGSKLRLGHSKGKPMQQACGLSNNAQGISCYRCGLGQHATNAPDVLQETHCAGVPAYIKTDGLQSVSVNV